MSGILLLHGLTGTPAEVAPLGALFSEMGNVVKMPWLPGHREGLEASKTITTTQFLDFVEAESLALSSEVRGPITLIGQSFGGLLALHAAEQLAALVSKIVVFAPPFVLRSRWTEIVLTALSLLPDSFLTLNYEIPKKKRDLSQFVYPREAFGAHSLGACARMVKIRRLVVRHASSLRAPLLVLLDPHDHHVDLRTFQYIQDAFLNAPILYNTIDGGEHELVIGPKSVEVCLMVKEFVTS